MIEQRLVREVCEAPVSELIAAVYAMSVAVEWAESHPAYIEAMLPFFVKVDEAADEYLAQFNR